MGSMDYDHWFGPPKMACFDCRKCFSSGPEKCPECGSQLHEMGTHFRAPKRRDVKAWKAIEQLYQAGVRFGVDSHSSRGVTERYAHLSVEEGDKPDSHFGTNRRALASHLLWGNHAGRNYEPGAFDQYLESLQWVGQRPTHPREVPAYLEWWQQEKLRRIAIVVDAAKEVRTAPPPGAEGKLLLEKINHPSGPVRRSTKRRRSR